MRITDGVLWNAHVRPNKVALCMDGKQLTFGELQKTIHEIVTRFYQRGYQPQNRIALILENSLEYVELFLGLVHGGMIVSPINPRLSDEEKTGLLSELNPDVVICEQDEIIYVYPYGSERNKVSLAQWLACHTDDNEDDCPFDLSDDDIFYLGFSSGTTGHPKGILRTHCSWTDSFFAMSVEFGLDEECFLLVPGPLCYSASLIACLHVLFIGGTVELHRRFEPARVLRRLYEQQMNCVFMVPAMYRGVIEQTDNMTITPTERPITFITAGDKMNEATKQILLNKFPKARLFEYYGTSEVGFVSVLKPEDQLTKPDSVGKPFFSAAVKCVKDEVWVRSTMGFAGYYGGHHTLETSIRRQNGWLATSDIGYVDTEGYLYITGRTTDRMVCGGLNMYPAEIQKIVESHPDVAEAFVFAVPDDRLGEKPVAVVVWKEGVIESAIRKGFEQFLKQSFTGFKRPRFWWSRLSLPRNASGKVLKAVLQADYESQMVPGTNE